MGKFTNIVPGNLFRKKSETEQVEKSDKWKFEKSATALRTDGNNGSESGDNSSDGQSSESKFVETLHRIHEESLEQKLYNLERNALFEQNNLIEKHEQEKREIADSFKDDKVRIKRAFANEKAELLKEIERKDKMLIELSKILKRECENSLLKQKKEMVMSFNKTHELLSCLTTKLQLVLENMEETIKNNQSAFNNLKDFQELKTTYESLLNSVNDIRQEKANNEFENEEGSWMKMSPLMKESNATYIPCSTTDEKEEVADERLLHNGKAVREPCDETEIQHELAQAYRQQKCELLKLFNTEKEEYIRKLELDKTQFEKEIRKEYDSRMMVERKAWQETIEDYEREIAILKFEREQMDRNYCIGMDELKTEFEREKRRLYRSYSETHAQLKKSLQCKKNLELAAEAWNINSDS